jgi:hypothetical protein
MRKIIFAATLIGAVGAAWSAIAGPGQCYDAYGRPVGPAYDTDHPNYGFLDSVVRRGGTCTGMQPNYNYGPRYRSDDDRRSRGYRNDDSRRSRPRGERPLPNQEPFFGDRSR